MASQEQDPAAVAEEERLAEAAKPQPLGFDRNGEPFFLNDRVQHPHHGPGRAVRINSQGAITVRLERPPRDHIGMVLQGGEIAHARPGDLVRLD